MLAPPAPACMNCLHLLRRTPRLITGRLVPQHSQTESLKAWYQCITQRIHHTVSLALMTMTGPLTAGISCGMFHNWSSCSVYSTFRAGSRL
jgi:hypothetical protein